MKDLLKSKYYLIWILFIPLILVIQVYSFKDMTKESTYYSRPCIVKDLRPDEYDGNGDMLLVRWLDGDKSKEWISVSDLTLETTKKGDKKWFKQEIKEHVSGLKLFLYIFSIFMVIVELLFLITE